MPNFTHKIVNWESLEILKGMPDNYVDSVVTDPPYGLSKEPDAEEVLTHWLKGDDYVHRGGGFMGKSWDSFVPGPAFWKEVYRVLKPGGHILVFAGTRTQDLMGMALRLAKFEIRDTIHWTYGSGFPKSLDVSKAIDKMRDVDDSKEREISAYLRSSREELGLSKTEVDRKVFGGSSRYAFVEGRDDPTGGGRIYLPTPSEWTVLKDILKLDDRFDSYILGAIPERDMRGRVDGGKALLIGEFGGDFGYQKTGDRWAGERRVTSPATSDAERYRGFGTALKPSHEPIILARKPLSEKTVAANVLKWGTGALNIDSTRVGNTHSYTQEQWSQKGASRPTGTTYGKHKGSDTLLPSGRWPSNTILAHHPDCEGVGEETVESWDCVDGCPVKELDGQSGILKSGDNAIRTKEGHFGEHGGLGKPGDVQTTYGDKGGASRFFKILSYSEEDYDVFRYVAKASKRERNEGLEGFPEKIADPYGEHRGRRMEDKSRFDGKPAKVAQNNHPTVKPLALMQYLVKLVTPPGGVVLDPFAGSGTTGVAALKEGFVPILIEREEEYVRICEARIANVLGEQ